VFSPEILAASRPGGVMQNIRVELRIVGLQPVVVKANEAVRRMTLASTTITEHNCQRWDT
jgi:hypothetical protein